ncbi:MAG: PepSY-associated TM helix domain-containing protein [Candidatus Latescibacterota bacterium]
MYVLVRTVHLFSGLVLAGGLFMYAATGFIMAHQDWFPGGESEKTTEQLTSEIAVRMGGGELPQEQADHWQRQLTGELGLHGRPGNRWRSDDGSWTFEYSRPGTNEKLRVRPGDRSVTLTVEAAGFAGIMNRLHHLRGYAGGPRFFLWGLFVDLTSLAMIFFPLTGIYLWYTLKKDHRLGWIVLGSSTAYGVGSILYLVLGR